MTTQSNDGSRRIAGPAPEAGAGRTETEHRRTETVVPGSDPTLIRPTATPAVETRPARPAKTSAAAAFALVFGVSALFCALTGLLSPVALVLGIIGIVLAVVGLKMAKRPGVTGRGVAIGGLVTALLGVVLGGVVLAGLAAVVNDQSQLDRIQRYIDDARTNLPSGQQIREQVPGQ